MVDPVLLSIVAMVVTFVLGILFGKKKFAKGVVVFDELVDVFAKVREIKADKTVTKAELLELMKEIDDVVAAIKDYAEAVDEKVAPPL